MKLTPGKLKGLKAVSNERGVIAAAAMDQRGSLQKSLAKEKGGEQEEGVQITLELIEKIKIKQGVHGIHLMAVGWEEIVPRIVKEAGLAH